MNKQKILHEKGLKTTTARLAVLNLLEEKKNPLDVETIVDNLNSQVDQATIYRILDILTEKRVVDRFDFGEGKYRYELQKRHHHHMVCTNCLKVEDIEVNSIKEIEDQIRNKKGFLVKSHSLEFFGLCKNCQH